MEKNSVGICPADIMLPVPEIDPQKWACVACDQFTSQPEYWEKVKEFVGFSSSTLKLMLPECYLDNSEEKIHNIHQQMKNDLDNGCIRIAVQNGYVFCERTTRSGTRSGLVCTIDLEDYDYKPDLYPLIRPTEQTITSRLPPRLKIREGAKIELTHIMILIDDPKDLLLGNIKEKKSQLTKLYDFQLMMDGGHLKGYAIQDQQDLNQIFKTMECLKDQAGNPPFLLAVGDGNHSLATAKAYWDKMKSSLPENQIDHHPARYALCEIVNIHDPALLFEPIHRILKNVCPEAIIEDLKKYAFEHTMRYTENHHTVGHSFSLVYQNKKIDFTLENPDGTIPCETIQKYLDDLLSRMPEAKIDYIHGEDHLINLSAQDQSLGFLLPEIDKSHFFSDIKKLGVLPRKTFSMGEANEKRYYMECKLI